MNTSSGRPQRNDQASERHPIQRGFLRVFETIERKVKFEMVASLRLEEHLLDALIQSSTSKCVGFNIVANQGARDIESSFFLISNLRGICEDLIYLTYLTRMDKQRSTELIKYLQHLNVFEGLTVQRQFFEVNDPIQPILKVDPETSMRTVKDAKKKIQEIWKSEDITNRSFPTVREIASAIGLTSTYDFIYFSTSNFVHFNPNALLRTGWGGSECGPYKFSTRHMANYYHVFNILYGAVLFIGFHASFGVDHFNENIDCEIDQMIELISQVPRWPEIITFEEMNQPRPIFILTHALREIFREEDETIPYGSILQELQNLKQNNGTT